MGSSTFDVVTVGGGLGASACAASMARSGMRVLVLEKETQFKDRVRGEYIATWGVAEARELGRRSATPGDLRDAGSVDRHGLWSAESCRNDLATVAGPLLFSSGNAAGASGGGGVFRSGGSSRRGRDAYPARHKSLRRGYQQWAGGADTCAHDRCRRWTWIAGEKVDGLHGREESAALPFCGRAADRGVHAERHGNVCVQSGIRPGRRNRSAGRRPVSRLSWLPDKRKLSHCRAAINLGPFWRNLERLDRCSLNAMRKLKAWGRWRRSTRETSGLTIPTVTELL